MRRGRWSRTTWRTWRSSAGWRPTRWPRTGGTCGGISTPPAGGPGGVGGGVAANARAAWGRARGGYPAPLGGVPGLAAGPEARVSGFLAALGGGAPDPPPLSASSAARAVVAVRGLHRFAARDG